MAYVLGFFVADGCLTKNSKRNNYYIDFTSTDYDVIRYIRKILSAKQKISKRKKVDGCKQAYRLQIGSKKIYSDLLSLGMKKNKSKDISYPDIPSVYFSDFLRGYFDGDGYSNCTDYWRSDRRKYSRLFFCGFVSGSKKFLSGLRSQIKKLIRIGDGSLHDHNNNYALVYSGSDTGKIYNFMYNGLVNKVCLLRKYNKFTDDIADILGS